MKSIIIAIITTLLASMPMETTYAKRDEVPKENLYYPKCEVIALINDSDRDYDPNLTFIKLQNGEIFSFWSCDLFMGDEFYALMNDNGTPYDYTDDEFVGVYSWKIDE